MDVLIKGMTMPRKGLSVVVDLWNNGKAYVYGNENAEMYEAVELPDHGDLIDRDALCVRGGRNCGKMFFAELLENAPVVIPAERSEDA